MFKFFNEGLYTSLTVSGNTALLVELLFIVAIIAVSYLLGSVNTAIIVSKIIYRDDIRKHGSGNAGMTNMLRTYGKGAAGLTLLGDLLKTVISIILAACLLGLHYEAGLSVNYAGYIAGLFAVLGHVFPIYYKFKGGKGVLVTASMALVLAPVPFLILFAIFVAVVWASKYLSLGSVTVAVLFPVVVHAYFKLVLTATPHGLISLCTIILAIFIVWCHRSNLERISNRTENKFSLRKKPAITKESAEEKNHEDSEG